MILPDTTISPDTEARRHWATDDDDDDDSPPPQEISVDQDGHRQGAEGGLPAVPEGSLVDTSDMQV